MLDTRVSGRASMTARCNCHRTIFRLPEKILQRNGSIKDVLCSQSTVRLVANSKQITIL